MDIALTAYNYSRICHIYNVYSGINGGINKGRCNTKMA